MISFTQFITEGVVKTDVSFVSTVFDNIEDSILYKDYDADKLARILNKAFKPYKVEFEYSDEKYRRPEQRAVGIVDSSFDNNTGKIYIGYKEEDFEYTFADGDKWKKFKDLVEIYIGHELVHLEQFKKLKSIVTDKKILNKIQAGLDTYKMPLGEYLAVPEEITAFASEAVKGLQQMGYTKPQIEVFLKNPSKSKKPKIKDSDSFSLYYDAYYKKQVITKDTWDKYLKTVYQYLGED